MAESPKEIVIVAGPNGAGKTTFAFSYLDVEARGLAFVNADAGHRRADGRRRWMTPSRP